MRKGTGGRRSSLAALVLSLLAAPSARGAETPASPVNEGGTQEGETVTRRDEPLSVVFDASAEKLPQAEIRAAIQEELRRPIATPYDAVSERLSVRVSSTRGLVLEFRSRGSVLERNVPLPSRPEDVPLVVALLAGNLVRDQRASLPPPGTPRAPDPPPAAAPAVAPEKEPQTNPVPPPPPPPRPARHARPEASPASAPPRTAQRHWFGVHVAQDLAIVGGSNVCDPTLGQASESYSCFLEGTDDRPFTDTPYPLKDGVASGLVVATTRLLVSYDHSLGRHVSLGARLGYAFGGGPPAGQTVSSDAAGTDGTPFLPVHAEARLTFWLVPPSEAASAFLGVSAGVAQVDAKVTVNEKNCTRDAQAGMPAGTSEADAFEACRIAASNFDFAALPDVKVDAWKKLGQGFYGLHAGASVELANDIHALANVNALFMTPGTGFVLEPSLGAMFGF